MQSAHGSAVAATTFALECTTLSGRRRLRAGVDPTANSAQTCVVATSAACNCSFVWEQLGSGVAYECSGCRAELDATPASAAASATIAAPALLLAGGAALATAF